MRLGRCKKFRQTSWAADTDPDLVFPPDLLDFAIQIRFQIIFPLGSGTKFSLYGSGALFFYSKDPDQYNFALRIRVHIILPYES